MADKKYFQAIGRRKESTASVRLFEGKGENMVNGKSALSYFPSQAAQSRFEEPFRVVEMQGKFFSTAKVSGGGKTGQLDAVVLGMARGLVSFDEKLRKPLRDAGLLTRNPREKERKKYFLLKARKRPQYSKR